MSDSKACLHGLPINQVKVLCKLSDEVHGLTKWHIPKRRQQDLHPLLSQDPHGQADMTCKHLAAEVLSTKPSGIMKAPVQSKTAAQNKPCHGFSNIASVLIYAAFLCNRSSEVIHAPIVTVKAKQSSSQCMHPCPVLLVQL
jgi:hypothetical protein